MQVFQTVTSVDSSKKTVTLDNGKETISYDTLILAPGGSPRRLPIDGANLENVYTFRDLDDSQKVDAGMLSLTNCEIVSILFYSGAGGKEPRCYWIIFHFDGDRSCRFKASLGVHQCHRDGRVPVRSCPG